MATLKLITNDYRSGTSSAIVDYAEDNFIIVSPENYEHVFSLQNEDICFVGHDFLKYLWNTPEKLAFWKNYNGKIAVWCFERILCHRSDWRDMSLDCLRVVNQFADVLLASDESDCRMLNIGWLPQWPSNYFYLNQKVAPISNKICFMGQSGTVGYEVRNRLLKDISDDAEMAPKFDFLSSSRKYGWMEYVGLLLSYKYILAPAGNLSAFNTRTYEALTSGRVVLQQVDSEMYWHQSSVLDYKNIHFYTDFTELKKIILNMDLDDLHIEECRYQYQECNLSARMAVLKNLMTQLQ